MFDTVTIEKLSTLDRTEALEIIKHYDELCDKWPDVRATNYYDELPTTD